MNRMKDLCHFTVPSIDTYADNCNDENTNEDEKDEGVNFLCTPSLRSVVEVRLVLCYEYDTRSVVRFRGAHNKLGVFVGYSIYESTGYKISTHSTSCLQSIGRVLVVNPVPMFDYHRRVDTTKRRGQNWVRDLSE